MMAVSGLSIIFSLVLSINEPTIQIKKYMTNLSIIFTKLSAHCLAQVNFVLAWISENGSLVVQWASDNSLCQ